MERMKDADSLFKDVLQMWGWGQKVEQQNEENSSAKDVLTGEIRAC